MTAQDTAGLVAELRTAAGEHGLFKSVEWSALIRAADALEAMGRELAEARAEIERLKGLLHANGKPRFNEAMRRAETAERLLSESQAEGRRKDEALRKIAEEARKANDVIRLNRDGSGQGRVKVATAMHRIANWAEAALTSAPAPEDRT